MNSSSAIGFLSYNRKTNEFLQFLMQIPVEDKKIFINPLFTFFVGFCFIFNKNIAKQKINKSKIKFEFLHIY